MAVSSTGGSPACALGPASPAPEEKPSLSWQPGNTPGMTEDVHVGGISPRKGPVAHRMTVPKDVHVLISATWGDVLARGRRDFAGVMKVKDLVMGD